MMSALCKAVAVVRETNVQLSEMGILLDEEDEDEVLILCINTPNINIVLKIARKFKGYIVKI